MDTRQTLTVGTDRFRVRPWHADPRTAALAVAAELPNPGSDSLRRCLTRLADEGYVAVMTNALHPREAEPFLRVGFEEFDRLLVLSHPLIDLDPPRPRSPGLSLRRARRSDRDRALRVDAAAFPTFWQLDAPALAEALDATPRSRFRVAERDSAIVGYAVTGRGGRQGFLQRLASDPLVAGHGVGSALVVDALRWAARRRARRVLVNTQRENERALALYRRLGFSRTTTDLVVLRRELT
jgi:ribosomal protein S18 acetylase RimI-like enzyme